MNTKNRLIEKLLKVAKHHKILTYPMLALVAVISIFGYFFNWSTGAGKRVVAIIMVMVMLVSQSYFLTSSATALVDTEETIQTQRELQEQNQKLVDDSETVSAENTTEIEKGETDTVNTDDTNSAATSNPPITNTESESPAETDTTDKDTIVDGAYVNDEDAAKDDSDNSVPESYSEDPDVVKATDATTVSYRVYGTVQGSNTIFYFGGYSNVQTKVLETDGTLNLESEYSSLMTNINANSESLLMEGCYELTGYWYYSTNCSDNTKVDLSSIDISKKNNDGVVELYAAVKIVKYKVTINSNGGSYSVTEDGAALAPVGTDTYYIKAGDAAPKLTINGTRKGYTLTGVNNESGNKISSTQTDDSSIEVNFSGAFTTTNLTQTITLEWTPEPYDILYKWEDEEGEAHTYTQKAEYDGKGTLEPPEVKAEPGYKVTGWTIKSEAGADIYGPVDSTALLKSVQDYIYDQEGVYLSPVYGLKTVVLDKESVTFNYDTIDTTGTTVKGKFDGEETSTDGLLQYKVLNSSVIPDAANITISGDGSTDGITFSTEGPDVYSVTYSVSIEVIHAKTQESYGTYTFKVKVDTCKLELSPEGKDLSKIYDGSTKVPDKVLNNLSGFATTCYGKPINSTITVDFTDAKYLSKNAGDTYLELGGTVTIYKDGAVYNGGGYELEITDYKVATTIKPRQITVITTNTTPTVKAGEADPIESFGFEIDPESPSNTGDAGLAPGESISDVRASVAGKITYITGRENDLLKEGIYKISIEPAGIANYELVFSGREGAKATLTVEKDAPQYKVVGERLAGNEWYYKGPVSIKSELEYYDTVRIKNEDGEEIEVPSSDANECISESGNFANRRIYIQLYKSTTGAETEWAEDWIKVDETVPEFVGYSVTYNGGVLDSSDAAAGSYTGDIFLTDGKLLGWGNFFRNTITVEVRYRDDTSGLSTVEWEGFESQTVTYSHRDDDGIWRASIEILNLPGIEKYIDTIQFKAKDYAGNEETAYNKLVYNGSDKWVVEDVAPEIKEFKVMAGLHHLTQVDPDSDKYYFNCQAVLDVEDATAGVFDVTWHVNDATTESKRVESTGGIMKSYQFTQNIDYKMFPSDDGVYTVYATVTDNAGNSKDTASITFKADDEPPVITLLDTVNGKNWLTTDKAIIRFTVSDRLSGMAVNGVGIACKEDDSPCDGWTKISEQDGVATYELDVSQITDFKSGIYYILAEDKVGNTSTLDIDLSLISDDKPECPNVSITPAKPNGENDWYTELPTITVLPEDTTTPDNVPVATRYLLWSGDSKDKPANASPVTITSQTSLESKLIDGENHLWIEAVAANGNKCQHEYHQYDILLDQNGPEISEPSLTAISGSSVTVSFTVSDAVSGVDRDKIKVKHGTKDFPNVTIVQQADGSYKGTFEVTETGDYSIEAYDLAGNCTTQAAYTPMSMKINAVKNITNTSATLGAMVIKGTYSIDSANIAYRKLTDSGYTTVSSVTGKDADGNWPLSAVLDNLEPGTSYAYRVRATSEAKEVLEYEGYFRTLSDSDVGIMISGTVRYFNPDYAKSVTVGLFKGNECIRAVEVKDTTVDNTFVFTNLSDGTYSVFATDGTYSKTARVVIYNNQLIYPENGRIDLVLSGKNTSVVITTDDTPNITADNLDSLFDDPTNISSDELKLIEEGKGTVEFKLYATLMRVSSVGPDEIAAMYKLPGTSNKIVGAYLDLSLYKIVTDEEGNVSRTRVTTLGGGANVSVTIPLGDLAEKSGLEVVRIHQNGDTYTGKSLPDMDGPGNSTYTITTTQFSTYAVLYDPDKATTQEPTTQEPTITEDIEEGSSNPSSDGNINVTTEDTDIDSDDDPDGTDTPDDPSKKPSSSTGGSSIGSLRSAGTAKTGDEAPIVALGVMMIAAMGGVIILRKKSKEAES